MQRREFIILLGGGAVGWPRAARTQPTERIRRVGMLMNLAATDPIGQARIAAFLQGLQAVGNLCRERLSDDELATYCLLDWDTCYKGVLAAIGAMRQ